MFKKSIVYCLFLFITTFVQAQDTNILDFGAKADGTTINTEAIQKAINQTAVKGGTVVIPQGEFLSGSLYIKSNVSIHIVKGAVLKGSPYVKDFPENTPSVKGAKPHRAFWKAMPSRALLYADNVDNIRVFGEGTIDGNGKSKEYVTEDDNPNRPKMIFFVNCRKVQVDGLTIQNTPFWLQHYFACDGVIVRGLTVYNHNNKNVDGIDIDSKNVVVSDCIFNSDDDGICFKSDGFTLCENVVITNCIVSSNCNFIKMGTASYAGFKNITITNCVLKRTSETNVRNWSKMSKGISDPITGLAGIALEVVDGGIMEKINISNIVMSDVQTPIFIKLGSRMNPTGSISHVTISNIIATSHSLITNSITAVPGFYVKDVVLKDMQFIVRPFNETTFGSIVYPTKIPENEKAYPENRMFGDVLPAYGFYLRHVQNIYFNNIHFTLQGKDNRPAFHIEDAANISIRDCKVEIPENNQPVINALDVNGLYVSNVFDTQPIPLLLRVSGAKSSHIKMANLSKKSFKYILDKDVPKGVFVE